MNKTFLSLTVTALCSYSSLVLAQQTSATDTMVVSANRIEQSTKSIIADVKVVTHQDIVQSQAKSLPEILRHLTGIQLVHNGGRGQTATIFVRGTNSDQVLVLVDGVRLSRAAKGAVDLSQIPINYVDRIEYVRGARASVYGSEAIGGVINIITIARSRDEHKQLTMGLGSLDYQQLGFATGVKTSDNSQLNLALGRESDKGYNVHPVSGINDGDRHGFKTTNGLMGYTIQVTPQFNLYGSGRAYKNIYQYDNSYTYNSVDYHYYMEGEREDQSWTLGGNYRSGGLQSGMLFNYQRQKGWDYTQSSGKSSGTADVVEQSNAQWSNSYVLNENLTLAGGLDWRNSAYTDKTTSKKYQRYNRAVYALATSQISKLILEGSARLDDNQGFGSKSTYNLGAGYQFIPEFGVKASYGTSFKAPNLYQQYDPTYGTDDLSPEKADSAELTFTGDVAGLNWHVTGYHYAIDNLIDYDYSTSTYQNVDGKSKIKGVELSVDFATGLFRHELSADIKSAKDSDGDRLSRRAKEMYKWHGVVTLGDYDWALDYTYVGKRPDSSAELSSYSLIDTAVSYYASSSVTVSGRISNLLNKDYETADGYPSPGRAYYVNVTYDF